MDDLNAAPQTGASEPASASSSTPSADTASNDTRSAIERAFAQVEAAEAARPGETAQAAEVLRNGKGADDVAVAKAEQAVAKAEQAVDKAQADERDEKGRFRGKDAAPDAKAETVQADASSPTKAAKYTPPDRFSADAKAAWETAPEPVQAEVHRAVSELEKGLEKYRGDAENWSSVRHYAEMAENAGVKFADVLDRYVELDTMLASNPVAAFEALAKATPYTVEQIAQHILNADPATREAERNYEEMQTKIARLKRQLNERAQVEQRSQQQAVQSRVEQFAAEAPRYAELEGAILGILRAPDLLKRTGDTTADLRAAYEMAERLNPLPVISPQAQPAQPPAAQTRKGGFSLTGSPGDGSNPSGSRPAPTSARDAVDSAWSRVMGGAQ